MGRKRTLGMSALRLGRGARGSPFSASENYSDPFFARAAGPMF